MFNPDYPFSVEVYCIRIDSLQTPESDLKKSLTCLPPKNFHTESSIFCVAGDEQPNLYVFGGLAKPKHHCYADHGRPKYYDFVDKTLYYDIPTPSLPATPLEVTRTSMDNTHMFESLVAQVGDDDSLYFLGFACDDKVWKLENVVQDTRLVINKYSLKTDDWKLVSGTDAKVNRLFDSVAFLRDNISRAPHVVIGNKLHVSFGKFSFAFEAVWEDSNLFKTFWSTLSPFKFPGGELWGVDEYEEKKSADIGGQPFGFHGRGIVWDNDILLGVLESSLYPLIAYHLIGGVVEEYQIFSVDELYIEEASKWAVPYAASLLGLGGDHFVLVHFRKHLEDDADCEDRLSAELVTFKLSRPEPAAPKGQLLKCEIVRRDIVADQLRLDCLAKYYAFVV